jgi:hypothetical protein
MRKRGTVTAALGIVRGDHCLPVVTEALYVDGRGEERPEQIP